MRISINTKAKPCSVKKKSSIASSTLTAQFWRMVKIAGLLPATREIRPRYHRPRNIMWKTKRKRIEEIYIDKNKDKFILISTPID